MTAFQTDDYYNVIPEHVIEALQLDTKLAADGALEVKTWEAELRANGLYNENELPGVAVSSEFSSQEPASTGSDRRVFVVNIFIITDGGRKTNVEQSVKAFAARIERAMQQQSDPTKQINGLTADLLESVPGSVIVQALGTSISDPEGQVSGNAIRGVAVMQFSVSIDFTITID